MTVGEMIDKLKEYPLDSKLTFTSWTPVTAGLPKPLVKLIVTRASGKVEVSTMLGLQDGTPIQAPGRDANGFPHSGKDGDVIAWQYFPAPYDGVECCEELKV